MVIVCLALCSMLFMQQALAVYVCPMPAMADTAEMSNCSGMDMEQPALCHIHAYGDTVKQTPDQSALPDLAPFIPAGLVMIQTAADLKLTTLNSTLPSLWLTHATAPPLAVRHCCFRI